MLTQFGCKRLKFCDLEQGFFLLGEQVYPGDQFFSMTKTFLMLILKDLLTPNTISLAELWDQSVFTSVGGGPFTFFV